MRAPSPPDAVGLNGGFASQFAPQFHASVVDGWQYDVLAKWVYGLNADICEEDSSVIFPESCRLHEDNGVGTARTAESVANSARDRWRVEAMISGLGPWESSR